MGFPKKQRLNDLLTLKNDMSIFDVIGRMEILKEECLLEKNLNGLYPFLEVYYLVTKNVAEKVYLRRSFYQNYKNMEKLDVAFAKLYFDPIKDFIIHKKKTTPWKNHLTLSELDVSAFIKVLTGINTHINSDLTEALVENHFTNEHDYMQVNDVLKEVLPELFKYLAFVEHDIYGFGGILLKGFTEYEFSQTLVKWRNQSWKNASLIRKKKISNYLKSLHIQTENNSLDILELLENYWKINDLFPRVYKLNKIKVIV